MVVLRFLRRSCTVETSPGCLFMRPAADPLRDRATGGEIIPSEWREEFEAAARRPLAVRMRYASSIPTNRCWTTLPTAHGTRPLKTGAGANRTSTTGSVMAASEYRQAQRGSGRLSRLSPRRHHGEQSRDQPTKGSRIAPAAAFVSRMVDAPLAVESATSEVKIADKRQSVLEQHASPWLLNL